MATSSARSPVPSLREMRARWLFTVRADRPEVLADEAVGPAVGDELEDADLPRGQVGQRRRGSSGDGGALQARCDGAGDDATQPALEQDAELGTAGAAGEDHDARSTAAAQVAHQGSAVAVGDLGHDDAHLLGGRTAAACASRARRA